MKFLQQPIEKKLSALIGAKVTFERMKISPLAGRLEAEGMTIGADAPEGPVVKVGRIEAHVSVARALAGQLSIRTLVVDGLEIYFCGRKDGTTNIPPGPPKFAAQIENQTSRESMDWEFAAESIRVNNASIRYQEDSYIAAAEDCTLEMNSADGGRMKVKGVAGRLGRRDEPVELGQVTVTGEVAGNPAAILREPMSWSAALADDLRVSVESAELRSGRLTVEVDGEMDGGRFLPALPPRLALRFAWLGADRFRVVMQTKTRFEIGGSGGRMQQIK